MAIVPTVPLRSQGLELSAQSLVCMGMSAFDGPPKPDEEISSSSIRLSSTVSLCWTLRMCMSLTQMRSFELLPLTIHYVRKTESRY
ncbi:hypothetical protein R1sor_022716 [Riccia sorocarpa]|uniref:Uncharacterized protein n=1 Tax=Riccia sorocarpa TaxID=122646 RepID=A0ABD3GNU2_9MARC